MLLTVIDLVLVLSLDCGFSMINRFCFGNEAYEKSHHSHNDAICFLVSFETDFVLDHMANF